MYNLFIILILLTSLGKSLIVDDWRKADNTICSILEEVKIFEWDTMLQSIETYTTQLKNITSLLPAKVKELWHELNPIIRNGRPRFITVPVFGPTLRRKHNLTDVQIFRVWSLRHLADQEYDRFIHRMTWMKKNNYLDFLKNTTHPKQ